MFDRSLLRPVAGSEVETELEELMAGQIATFDPSTPYTMSGFIRLIRQKYSLEPPATNGNHKAQSVKRQLRKLMDAVIEDLTDALLEINFDDEFRPAYDILQWLMSKAPEMAQAAKDSVDGLVDAAYLEKGKKEPEQFIDTHLDSFLGFHGNKERASVSLNVGELQKFFNNVLPALAGKKMDLPTLRAKLLERCRARLDHIPEVAGYGLSNTPKDFRDREFFERVPKLSFKEAIMAYVKKATNIEMLHVNILNPLSTPGLVPEEIHQRYKEWFEVRELVLDIPFPTRIDQINEILEARVSELQGAHPKFTLMKGETVKYADGANNDSVRVKFLLRNDREYEDFLRQLFGRHPDSRTQHRRERVDVIKRRLAEQYFAPLDEALEGASSFAGRSLQLCDRVRQCRDLSELVLYAAKGVSALERFEARRTYELLVMDHSAKLLPRFAFRQHDLVCIAEAVTDGPHGIKPRLDMDKMGAKDPKDCLSTPEMFVLERIYFRDLPRTPHNPDGRIMISKGKVEDYEPMEQGEELNHLDLFPVSIGGEKIRAWMLPGTDAKGNQHFLDSKDLREFIFKMVRKGETLPEDVQDATRMKLCFRTMADLEMAQRHLMRYFASFGLLEEFEDKYKANQNAHSASSYGNKTFILRMPALDHANDKDYRATVEVQLELLEDVCREKSKFHRAGHDYYKMVRFFALFKKLAPKEIDEYRELFWTNASGPIDELWGRERWELTKKLELEEHEADLKKRAEAFEVREDF